MATSDRNRLSILLVFFISLVAFAVFYHPTSALSRPAIATTPAGVPLGTPLQIKPPLGLPPIPIPPDNPLTENTVSLGRRLYYDPVLSADGTVSCASCHGPQMGFTDTRPLSLGVGGKKGTRHAPTVMNSVYNSSQFWDGRAASLEEQAKGPIANPVEMAMSHADAVKRLQSDTKYIELFRKAWGTDQITIDLVAKSIASFERTLVSGNSDFDRFYYGHDRRALSAAARRGFNIFIDPKKGNCQVCHTISKDHALFTDNKFHNLGIGADVNGKMSDVGRFEQTKIDADWGAFKTPSLRNIAQRAPYMHDGSFPTLRDAVGHYIGGGNANPHLDKEIRAIALSLDEREDLVAFLESLTGPLPDNVGPPPDMADRRGNKH